MNKQMAQLTIDKIDEDLKAALLWCANHYHDVVGRQVKHIVINDLRTKKALLQNQIK